MQGMGQVADCLSGYGNDGVQTCKGREVREGMAQAERTWLDKRSVTRHSEWGVAILGGE